MKCYTAAGQYGAYNDVFVDDQTILMNFTKILLFTLKSERKINASILSSLTCSILL